METSQVENMLQMIDPKHGIVIDDKIGLLGEFESEYAEEMSDLDMRKNGYNIDCFKTTVAKTWNATTMFRRGQYFKVINKDGCFLFDEYITESGIIYKNNIHYGYVFILKDYKAIQVFDGLFDEEDSSPAIVIYANDKLYINNVQDKKIMNKFEYNDSIILDYRKPGEYKLEFNDDIFYSTNIDYNFNFNKINIFRTMKLHI